MADPAERRPTFDQSDEQLAAATALASGQDLEETLGELAKIVVQAGRDHHEMLQAEFLPVAGSVAGG